MKKLSRQYTDVFQNKVNQEMHAVSRLLDGNVDEVWTAYGQSVLNAAKYTVGMEESPARTSWFDNECQFVATAKNEAYCSMIDRRRTEHQPENIG